MFAHGEIVGHSPFSRVPFRCQPRTVGVEDVDAAAAVRGTLKARETSCLAILKGLLTLY